MVDALIVGGGGQDGAYIARALIARGDRVAATSRMGARADRSGLARLGVADAVAFHALGEDDDPASLLRLLAPRQIFVLAGQSSVARSFEDPQASYRGAALFARIVEAARHVAPDARILNAASGDCFGETPADNPARATSRFAPRSPYGIGKATQALATTVAREAYGQHVSTAFLFNHESPLRPNRFVIAKLAESVVAIATGRLQRIEMGDLSVVRDWGLAEEHCAAMIAMLDADAPGDYVIATGRSVALEAVVAHAFARFGRDWRDHVTISDRFRRPTDITIHHADPALARERLGWHARHDAFAMIDRLIDAAESDGEGAASI